VFDLPAKPMRLPNGLATRVFDGKGAGAPVILLHGLALSIEIWGKVVADLAAKYRVIAFDFPGFGEADRPDAPYDSAFFGDQVIALMDALGLERAHIVGSSLGGSTLVRLSAQHLHRIDHAVLMAPGGFGRAANPLLRAPTLPLIGYALGKPTAFSNAFALRLSVADKGFATQDMIDLMTRYARRPGPHRAFVRTVKAGLTPFGVRGTESFLAAARDFRRPVLVLWGEQDHVFPIAQAEIARRTLPDVRVQRIDRCGHYPHWERPDIFLGAVSAFLPSTL
jgi:pimeloyl-ACP methyl ester carboxylesterase